MKSKSNLVDYGVVSDQYDYEHSVIWYDTLEEAVFDYINCNGNVTEAVSIVTRIDQELIDRIDKFAEARKDFPWTIDVIELIKADIKTEITG